MTRPRRAVLVACGAGLTTLAGCSALAGDGDMPSYDTARLAALGRTDVPRPPATFPVSITDAMVSRHRDRARELIERVPEQPDIRNGEVRERLREQRTRVRDRLDAAGDGATDRARQPLRRLAAARDLREDAAAVDAAYRAATNDVTQQAVADRRAQLRSGLVTFERDWTYRGDDPAPAVVVHRALEQLRLETGPAIAPERAFPADPTTDAFRVGELVQHLERGEAALTDAERLRTRYREGLSDPNPYWTAISVAAERLRRIGGQYRQDLHFYIDADAGDRPFDRSIEDTPLERLYRWAIDGLEVFRTDAEEARYRGDRATALIARAIHLTVLRALDTIVTDIENDEIAAPETVDDIAAARTQAIEALDSAWATPPTVLAVEVAHWSHRLVVEARDRLRPSGSQETETPTTRHAHETWAMYVTAARVAAAVPQTVADSQAALRAAGA